MTNYIITSILRDSSLREFRASNAIVWTKCRRFCAFCFLAHLSTSTGVVDFKILPNFIAINQIFFHGEFRAFCFSLSIVASTLSLFLYGQFFIWSVGTHFSFVEFSSNIVYSSIYFRLNLFLHLNKGNFPIEFLVKREYWVQISAWLKYQWITLSRNVYCQWVFIW